MRIAYFVLNGIRNTKYALPDKRNLRLDQLQVTEVTRC